MDEIVRALDGIRDAAARAAAIRPVVTNDYLVLIHRVEQLAGNCSGADKTERVRTLSAAWPTATAGPLNPRV